MLLLYSAKNTRESSESRSSCQCLFGNAFPDSLIAYLRNLKEARFRLLHSFKLLLLHSHRDGKAFFGFDEMI